MAAWVLQRARGLLCSLRTYPAAQVGSSGTIKWVYRCPFGEREASPPVLDLLTEPRSALLPTECAWVRGMYCVLHCNAMLHGNIEQSNLALLGSK